MERGVEEILKVSQLKVTLQGNRILQGLDLGVSRGEMLGLIGPNGSGKTTLFNALSGFVPVGQGSMLLNGREIGNLSPSVRARLGLGRVFQVGGIFREMSVVENMLLAIEARDGGWGSILPWTAYARGQRREALEILGEVGLEDKSAELASALSGGQLRLLELARVIAYRASVLLLDEPTAGVSPKMKNEVMRVIEGLRQRELTVLIIEHDINFIQSLCDTVAVLNEGRVVMHGPPQQIRNDPKLQEIYFGQTALPSTSRGS